MTTTPDTTPAPEAAPVLGTTILRTLEDGVLTLTLNRPEAANALRPDQRDLLIQLLADAGGDHDVRVVVLAANGRHFCSGADVAGLGGDPAERVVGDVTRRIMVGAQALVAAVLDCPKPVVAVVQGAAAGIGAHLAYAADMVVASEAAYFSEAFILRGIVVDGGGAYLLPRRIGLQKAKELAFFGDRLPASEALALGLVNRVVPAEELATAAAELVGRLATAPTTAIALVKRMFNASQDGGRSDSFLLEGMAQELQGHAFDAGEGIRSFKERRPSEFQGR
jgi:2-(1,2-epoxy-1,2-dihydrophenyl)acetyl-CoA isomerase